MGTKPLFAALIAASLLVAGCNTPVPPGTERGPDGTIAYEVPIEASTPGARIEVNGQVVGNTPLRLKIYGDRDGTFHDFGSYHYVVRALPIATNQFVQTRMFQTGHLLTPEDHIPAQIYFDMNQPAPQGYGPPPGYAYPPPGYYYGPSPYYGPSFRFYFGGPGYYHHHW